MLLKPWGKEVLMKCQLAESQLEHLFLLQAVRRMLMLKSVSLTETWNQHSEYYSNSYFKLIYFNVYVIRVLKPHSCNQMGLVSLSFILSCLPICRGDLICFQSCFLLKIFRCNNCSNTCGTLALEEWIAFHQYANTSILGLEKDFSDFSQASEGGFGICTSDL